MHQRRDRGEQGPGRPLPPGRRPQAQPSCPEQQPLSEQGVVTRLCVGAGEPPQQGRGEAGQRREQEAGDRIPHEEGREPMREEALQQEAGEQPGAVILPGPLGRRDRRLQQKGEERHDVGEEDRRAKLEPVGRIGRRRPIPGGSAEERPAQVVLRRVVDLHPGDVPRVENTRPQNDTEAGCPDQQRGERFPGCNTRAVARLRLRDAGWFSRSAHPPRPSPS